MTNVLAIAIVVPILLVAAILGALELHYRLRRERKLRLVSQPWTSSGCLWEGNLIWSNPARGLETVLIEVQLDVRLLSSESLDGCNARAYVVARHPEGAKRKDGYWVPPILPPGKSVEMQAVLEFAGENPHAAEVAIVTVRSVAYGSWGWRRETNYIVVPLKFPTAEDAAGRWRSLGSVEVLPVKTHLLCAQDDPAAVVERYALPHAKPGDIVTLGETPLAIMQGRWFHPESVRAGWAAERLCFFFDPAGSLATPSALQVLADRIGAWRVLLAFLIGSAAKVLLRQPGYFYRVAGPQSRLIDDAPGTLPPYDRFIVLGPENPERTVARIQQETGLAAAIVDANDLGAVNIEAATPDVPAATIVEALRSNPAGNADEQTPLVLIRPVRS